MISIIHANQILPVKCQGMTADAGLRLVQRSWLMKFRQVATNRSQRWRDHKSLPPDIPQRFTFIVRRGSVAERLKALVLAHSTDDDGDIIIFIKQQNESPLRFQTPPAAGFGQIQQGNGVPSG
jgi:hypothetical protein